MKNSPAPVIGFALGGGSARGWAHIGVIQAPRQAGIDPAVVAGTSLGALVGAACVSGRLDDLKNRVESLTWQNVVGLLDVTATFISWRAGSSTSVRWTTSAGGRSCSTCLPRPACRTSPIRNSAC
ncbi:MAG: patatin-like phospholipase family protein [Betaproteobacteria bacterium]